MLGNFENKTGAAVADFEGIEDGGQLFVELNIHNGTNDGNNTSIDSGSSFGCFGLVQQLSSGEVFCNLILWLVDIIY